MFNKNLLLCVSILFLISASLIACAVLPGATAKPKPGATFSGPIEMDKAKSAEIAFKVSDDGQNIEWISVSFTELACDGFSAGSSSTKVSAPFPITDGKFEIKSSNIGEVSGQFTSPTAVKGSAHLAFFDGKAECGTWDWSATGD